MMTTKEVAHKLISMCRSDKIEEAKQEFFTEETTSIEPREGILPKESKGLSAIQKKAELFIPMVDEFYGSTISDPVIAGNFFSVAWHTDIKMKGQPRQTNSQVCLYQVSNGKIISEQFFY